MPPLIPTCDLPDLGPECDECLDHDCGLRVDVRAPHDLGALQRLVLARAPTQRHHRGHLLKETAEKGELERGTTMVKGRVLFGYRDNVGEWQKCLNNRVSHHPVIPKLNFQTNYFMQLVTINYIYNILLSQ